MFKTRDYMVLHVDLFVRSMERSLDFYCNRLGFSVFEDAILEGPLIKRVSNGLYDALRLVLIRSSSVGAMIELQEFQAHRALTPDAATQPLRKGWISILVPDLRALIGNLRAQDLHPDSEIFVVELTKSRACEAVFYHDPDGNDLEFLQIQA
jgi:catechol 2,3-dioxygenase-like lactoylglutathione lyase family enzyme